MERDLTWAEFFAVYMYVYVVMHGRKWEGNLTEASARDYYEMYLRSNESHRKYPNSLNHSRELWLDDYSKNGASYRLALKRLGLKV